METRAIRVLSLAPEGLSDKIGKDLSSEKIFDRVSLSKVAEENQCTYEYDAVTKMVTFIFVGI